MKVVLRLVIVLLVLGLRLEPTHAQRSLTAAEQQQLLDLLHQAEAIVATPPAQIPAPTAPVPVPSPVCKTTSVASGGNLQAAINAAAPCDTLALAAGATFSGNFVLPAKTAQPPAPYAPTVTITTSATLPAGRVTPALASLMPKIKAVAGSGYAGLRTAPSATHYVVRGVEFLPAQYDIIDIGDGSAAQNTLALVPDDITLDQCYVHGDPAVGQKRGIALNSGATVISNSYISGIRVQGQDSQAIGGWNGPGPYTITNNYLEAASEPIMFGGSDPAIAGLVPSNIVISGNYITKPLAWKGQAGWNIKTGIELKSAAHALIQGNVIENVWQDAQMGYAVVLTVRNQDGACPQCTLNDIKVIGNVVRHAGAGVNILGQDDGDGRPNWQSTRAANLVVSGNLFYDIDATKWGGAGELVQIMDGPNGLIIDHNTFAQPPGYLNALLSFIKGKNPIAGFVFTNNIGPEGAYGLLSQDGLGVGASILPAYAPGFTWSGDTVLIEGGHGGYTYPAGTVLAGVDPATPINKPVLAADYTLLSGFTGGADIAGLKAAIPGLDLTK